MILFEYFVRREARIPEFFRAIIQMRKFVTLSRRRSLAARNNQLQCILFRLEAPPGPPRDGSEYHTHTTRDC